MCLICAFTLRFWNAEYSKDRPSHNEKQYPSNYILNAGIWSLDALVFFFGTNIVSDCNSLGFVGGTCSLPWEVAHNTMTIQEVVLMVSTAKGQFKRGRAISLKFKMLDFEFSEGLWILNVLSVFGLNLSFFQRSFFPWHVWLPIPIWKNVRRLAIAALLRLVGGGDLYTVLTNREPARLQARRLICNGSWERPTQQYPPRIECFDDHHDDNDSWEVFQSFGAKIKLIFLWIFGGS